jgi:ATP phosphoribosyltransferase regulatory subunit
VQRLQDKAADAKEPPLAPETVQLIENYLHTRGDVATALRAVESLARQANIDLGDALEDARALFYGLKALAGPTPIVFEADFGRHFEYYTGMVFQVEIDSAGFAGQIAGGGRYDGLIHALSRGMHNIPAVGAALHTERLLAAAR